MVESVLSIQFGAACDGGGGANCCTWSVGFRKGYVARVLQQPFWMMI